jgi:hypothetical protein
MDRRANQSIGTSVNTLVVLRPRSPAARDCFTMGSFLHRQPFLVRSTLNKTSSVVPCSEDPELDSHENRST